MSTELGTNDPFRLNFEQQGKRAKELLKAVLAEDPDALARFARAGVGKPGRSGAPLKLADAHRVIAHELRFDDWAHLKRHIASMTVERTRMATRATAASALDADLRTLHIRCGSDLRAPLQAAGFGGDFYEHSYPYLIGPVHEGPGVLEERARFIVDSYAGDRSPPLQYESVLASIEQDERTLAESADYGRVVIWSEGDVYDQLVLIRLLGHFARHRRPARIELINSGDFPGGVRFIGLGQLPPEALRLLWKTRESAGPAQLVLGLGAWRALANDNPTALAAIARGGTPALPLLAPALSRHLSELPATRTGLSLTERLALTQIAAQPCSLNRVFARLNYFDDPLPGQGDSQLRDRVLGMEVPDAPVFTRTPGLDAEGRARPPWTDVLTLTDLGRRVLAGEVDFRSLRPPPRWVGGVRIGAGAPDWRWDREKQDVVLNPGATAPLQSTE